MDLVSGDLSVANGTGFSRSGIFWGIFWRGCFGEGDFRSFLRLGGIWVGRVGVCVGGFREFLRC